MASIALVRGKTLPDSGVKNDLHELIDLSTATITNIVNADVDTDAAIAGTKINTDFGAQTTNGTNGFVPIGGIIPWAKTLTGVPALPANFIECDGSTISDATSALNGTTVPDLNGSNYFLRGNSTSGGTGGSETMAHNHTTTIIAGGTEEASAGSGVLGNTGSHEHTISAASNTENRPPFYDVVWIIRIK